MIWKINNYFVLFDISPEAYGVISGAIFLIITFLFIPLRFYETLVFDKELSQSQVKKKQYY